MKSATSTVCMDRHYGRPVNYGRKDMDKNTNVIQEMIDAFTRVVRELETENAELRAENEELRKGLSSSVQAIGFQYDAPIGYYEGEEDPE